MTGLTSLTLSSHALTSVDVSALTELETLYLNNNQLTSVDLSQNTKVSTLHLEGNELASVDLSAQTLVKTLYLSDNTPLSSVVWPESSTTFANLYALNLPNLTGAMDLSAYEALTFVNFNNGGMSSIDVSGRIMTSLFFMNSPVTEVKVDSVKTTLTCTGTRLTPATLPQLAPRNYNYAPLAAYELGESIEAGEPLDLSGAAALDSAVYCEITSALFPKLTGASAYKTTEINVVAKEGSAIDEAAAEAPVKVYAASGRIVVENVEPSETVAVYALSGVKCAEQVMRSSRAEWEMPQGIYIVVAGTQTVRVIVK